MRQQLSVIPAVNYRFPGEYIKAVRKRLKMSQQEAAKEAGMSSSALSKLESGHHMQTRNIFKLSEVLGINPKDLVWEDHHSKEPEGIIDLDSLKKICPHWKDVIKQGIKELL